MRIYKIEFDKSTPGVHIELPNIYGLTYIYITDNESYSPQSFETIEELSLEEFRSLVEKILRGQKYIKPWIKIKGTGEFRVKTTELIMNLDEYDENRFTFIP